MEDEGSPSNSQTRFIAVFFYASAIPGAVISFLVLLAYASVAIPKVSRRCLDRVSFRLLSWSLLANVIYGISWTASPSKPGIRCVVAAYFINFTLFLATFLTTCIAINLQLVLVHGVNGRKMEKFYLMGTLLLSLALTVPVLGFDMFGWDEENAVCWYTNDGHHRSKRLHWLIGTQSVWISLSAAIETICSSIVLLWLYEAHRSITRLVVTEPQTNISSVNSESSNNSFLTQSKRFRKIVFRIAMYPTVSFLLNYSSVVLDLYTSIVGMQNHVVFALLVLDLVVYALRPLVYGILAATDPSFTSAVSVLRESLKQSREERKRRKIAQIPLHSSPDASRPVSTEPPIELATTPNKDADAAHSGGDEERPTKYLAVPGLDGGAVEAGTTVTHRHRDHGLNDLERQI